MEIKIKIGNFEIEFEGEEDFLREDLKKLVSNISGHFENNLKKRNKIKKEKAEAEEKKTEKTAAVQNYEVAYSTEEKVEESSDDKIKNMSISDVADKIIVKSGADLIIAAATRFTFILNKDTFTLQEILEEMKEANGYFTKNYNINIGQYLMLLIKERKLKKMGDAGYRLRSAEKARLEKILLS